MLFDLPDVVETVRGAIDRHIAAGRVEKVAGDFSEAVPPGGDAYLLKWIVHDWDDSPASETLDDAKDRTTRRFDYGGHSSVLRRF